MKTTTTSWGTAARLARTVAVALCVIAGGAASAEQAAPGASPAGAKPAVRVNIVRVRASGTVAAGEKPEIDAALESLKIPRLRMGYARYVHEETVSKELTWGEPLTMPVDATKGAGGGTYQVVPIEVGASGKLLVRVEERAPAAREPCLKMNAEVGGGVHLSFCDMAVENGTILFFVTAEAL